ncbi:hypothetical protein CANARDRAFT_26242 [[Candida] arabinofermentans NRRL YB-2248]|uniref:Yippee domain-containing protein n=1 Tax=[Candida] arabinofermentans NRRL YB-2248 TaxID=983967 RepID=A0A1E4T8L1_9ASCO|nr:hypothetical protein CANARDRAFT_26242 [[Candida] arabinofermentans NRRL YB-2248]
MGLIYADHFKTIPSSPTSSSSSSSPPPPYIGSSRRSSSSSTSSANSHSFTVRSSLSSIYSPSSSFSSTGSSGCPHLSGLAAAATNPRSAIPINSTSFQDASSSSSSAVSTIYYDKHNILTTQSNVLKILRCKQCHNHICLNTLIISDNFYGNSGPAFFVSKVLNIKLCPSREFKKMRTGRYEIKLIGCKQCGSNLGWKYLYSEDDKEKYKEGRYVIERNLLEEVDEC